MRQGEFTVIQVELRADQHRLESVVLATLTVHDDLSHRVRGDHSVVDLTEQMLTFPGPRRVSFTTDPVGWARALPRNLCSPYLYAVVVEDTAPGNP